MSHYNFKSDLPISKATDQQISDYLCANQGMTQVSTCNTNAYDLLMKDSTGKQFTIETKEDFTCERTGNVGVEYHCRGKPSGISVSQADFYYYKIHEPGGIISLYKIPTAELKAMIAQRLYCRDITGGDPGSNSKNYLFRLPIIKQHFTFVCNLP